MIGNTFPERAVNNCVLAMNSGKVSMRHVVDVLKYENTNVAPIEPFLHNESPVVRLYAAKIIGSVGDPNVLFDAAKEEKDQEVLTEILSHLHKLPHRFEELVSLLSTANPVKKDAAITAFRKAGRTDLMVGLLFDPNDAVITRVAGYMNREAQEKEDA